MIVSRAFTAAFALASAALVSASSSTRNPLKAIGLAKNPSILTQNHRVTALSTFDVAFDYGNSRVRLSLEPNHDIFVDGATVQYLAADGSVAKEEPIERLAHKVFKGTAWLKRGNRWDNVGWARISMLRDGVAPLFEGAFTVQHDHHHVQLSSSYKQTRQEMDPDINLRDDEYMVVFRDSDISTVQEHTELRKREQDLSCRSDSLEFNTMPDHPIYADMLRRDDGFWTSPISSLMGKRQLDNPQGGGNGAGVNLASSIGSTNGCPTTRKVALVGVATDCTYTGAFNSSESARANVINQMNTASNLFEQTFNISLGLANLVVTDKDCPATPNQATPWNQACNANLQIQQRLNLFSGWRGQQKDSNSHWTLLSTCNTGSAVGLAWLGQICQNGSGANSTDLSGNTETVSGANIVIRTSTEWQVIAHETGHTFGAVHDCTTETCQDQTTVSSQQCCPLSSSVCNAGQQFIMNPSTAQGITRFSACSIGNICSAMLRNSVKTVCLTNNKGVTTISGQQCGNGIVEDGEDCDCGGEQGCGNNACCDAKTCKFKSGAVCDDSNEDCCKNCQMAPSTTVCRVSAGQCDPEEKCTGSSPYCPEDKTKDDGSDCGNGLKCASGQCTSRDQQCKTVMGSYTQGNDTYACDNNNCMLSCGSPEFGRNVCYGLQQNFLDGTPCTGGGKCQNGQCNGSSVAKEVQSWIDSHKPLVIGLASAIGGLILLSILGCCYRSCKRRRQRKIYAAAIPYRGAPGQLPPRSRSRGRRYPPQGPNDSGGPLVGAPAPNGYAQPPWQAGNIPQPPPMYQRSSSVRYA
ncbi:ADAM 8 precursor [Clohesyomyces aquaticus]|uniref:Disintegrin and metalloproteinase domain-containing protein B n=1 Tax=Clohesyomyces aquaticus TaxID=1231657 RepID=A0A1Y1ZQ27_9PLEO|nr:ADAM 8 precursor [Clohesyomyces aquaticus]